MQLPTHSWSHGTGRSRVPRPFHRPPGAGVPSRRGGEDAAASRSNCGHIAAATDGRHIFLQALLVGSSQAFGLPLGSFIARSFVAVGGMEAAASDSSGHCTDLQCATMGL